MKTSNEIAASALHYANWTKLTLEELFMCGRIVRSDEKTIMDFIIAANGRPETIEEFQRYKEAIQIIVKS